MALDAIAVGFIVFNITLDRRLVNALPVKLLWKM